MGQERAHRRYSPSQAERFFNCEGSVRFLERVPARPPSEYAIEGTNAHTVIETALKLGLRDAKEAHRDFSPLFNVDLDDGTNEFYLSVQSALNYVYDILDADPGATLYTETFVDPPLPSAPGAAGGYCDVAIHVPSERALYVIDYKHGAGIAKDVRGNRQALQYAGGALYGKDRIVDVADIDVVTLVIIQPRAFHPEGSPREVSIPPFEVWEYLEELDAKVQACEQPDAPLTPGDDQCRFCDARTVCPAREAAALQVANSAFNQIGQVRSPDLPVPTSIDINRLGLIRFHAPMLRKWLDDVDAHCIELARQGFAVPGAKLVEAQARRKWYGSEDEVAKKLAALIGERDPEAVYKKSLPPILTAEKMVVEAYKKSAGRGRKKQAAEQAKQAFAYLTLKQSSGNLNLVNEDDPRPAVKPGQSTFTQIAGLIPVQNEDQES